MAKKIELLNDQQEVVHPLTSPDCIIMENGKTLDEVMGDDVATPTITHESTSFQVGVGDSNVEVVDGDVANMTLKGQSYQNILPKPTTLIMETDEQEFKINDKIDSNIIIDDNIAEIATVKGKTIVNVVQEESGSEYSVLGEDLSGQGKLVVENPRNSVNGMTLTNLGSDRTKTNDGSSRLINGNKIVGKIMILNGCPNDTCYFNLWNIGGDYYKSIKITSNKFIYEVPSNCYVYNIYDTKSYDDSKFSNLIIVKYQEDLENIDIPYFEGTKYFESNIKGVTLQGQTLVNTIQEPCEAEYVVVGEELSGKDVVLNQGIMNLEGDTLTNVLPKPSLRGSMENTSTQKLNTRDDVVDVDGELRGATLKGKTLVNLAGSINAIRTQHTEVDEIGYVTITNYSNYQNYFTKKDSVKPSTKYLIIVDIGQWENVEYATSDSAEAIFITSNHDESKNCFPQIVISRTDIGKGIYKFITTSKDDLSDANYGLRTFTYVKSGAVKYRIALIEYQEGMENWDIPYFEGMASVSSSPKTFHVLPEPSLRGSMENKAMQRLNEGHDEVVVKDGEFKSAILKGNTLVNIFKSFANYTYSASEMGIKWLISGSAPLTETLNNDELTMTLTGVGSKVVRIDDVSMLKPNTKYMVKINYTTSFENGINFGYLNNSTFYTQIVSMKSNEYAIFTTPSDLSTWVGLWFGVLGDLQTGDTIKISKPVLVEYQEGMENWDIPYFEGMSSVKMPVLTTTGKNLVDGTGDYVGLKGADGETGSQIFVSDGTLKRYSHIVRCKPNTTYTLTTSGSANRCTIGEFNEYPKVGLVGTKWGAYYTGATLTITTKPTTNYLVCYSYYSETAHSQSEMDEIVRGLVVQLEESSTATSYEPHKSNTLQTLIPCSNLDSTHFEQGTISETKPIGTPYKDMLSTGYMDIRLRSKSLIKVVSDTLEVSLNNGYGVFIAYFKDGKYMNNYNPWMDTTNFTVKLPQDCTEISITLRKGNSDFISVSDYDSIGLELKQDISLRAIGDVKDELDLLTGELTQRIGEVVLDGDEAWAINGTFDTVVRAVCVRTKTFPGIKNSHYGISDSLPSYLYGDGSVVSGNSDIEGLFHTNNETYIRVLKTKLTSLDVKGLCEYLSQNPIKVQYELMTPTTRTVNVSCDACQYDETLVMFQDFESDIHVNTSSHALQPQLELDYNSGTISGTNGIIDSSVEVEDIKTASLKGQTLVNLLNNFTNTDYAYKNDDVITVVSPDNSTWHNRGMSIKTATPNVKYIVCWDSLTYTHTDSRGTSQLLGVYGFTEDNTQITVKATEENQTTNYLIFTIPSTVTSKVMVRVHSSTFTGQQGATTTVKGLKVFEYQEGMEHWDIPYFEGMQSVEMPVLTTIGKNLFDKDKETSEYYINNIGQYAVGGSGNFINQTHFIDTKRYVSVSYSERINTAYVRLAEFDKNNKFIKRTMVGDDGNLSFELSANTHYIVTSVDYNANYFVDLQIEFSSVATPYEPHKPNTLTMNNILLIDGGYTNGYIDDKGVYITTTVDFHTNDFTPIKPNTELVTNASTLYYYDENKNWIGRAKQLGYTAPANARYIKAQWGEKYTINDLWVRENVVLRAIGDVKDELDLLTGRLTQRIGEVVLDGVANTVSHYATYDTDTHRTYIYYVTVNGLAQGDVKSLRCDKLPVTNAYTSENVEGIIKNSAGSQLAVRVVNSRYEAYESFNEYLKSNPITVQYVLETPIIRTVDLSAINQDNTALISKPRSYKDGHIQASHQEGSLLPSVSYEIPTTNSHHIDMATVGEKYTVKGDNTNELITYSEPYINNDTNLMVIKGDYVDLDVPHFENKGAYETYTHVKPIVKTVGKNLVNEHTMVVREGVSSSTGEFGYDSERKRSDFIPFNSKNIFGQGLDSVFCYDINKNFLGRIFLNKTNKVLNGTSFIVCRAMIETTNITVSELDSTYEPYKSSNVAINEEIELRSVGDVRDELNVITGKLTQRIGEAMFDGSEDWKILASYTNEYRINFVLNRGEIPSNCNLICNQYVTTNLRQDDTLTDYMYVGNLNINVFTKPNITLDEFKLQLQSNPLILQYPLATPIIKTIDLTVTDQDNVVLETGKPLSYKDGHIQAQCEGNSLLPDVDYEIPTSNSYHIDTFKQGVTYTAQSDTSNTTVALTSANTNPYINGESNLMLIEGDYTSVDVPYFEGTKLFEYSTPRHINGATLEGQTHISLVTSMANTMENTSMQKLNEGYDEVVVVDGEYKNAILKGNTLVNLLKSSHNVTVTANGSWITTHTNMINDSMIKPSTTYTLITYVHSNTIEDGDGYIFGVGGGNQSNFLFIGNQVVLPQQTGMFKTLLTTRNDTSLNYTLQQVMYNTCTQGAITFSQVLLEGDHTNTDIPYFEGMTSVKMPVLKTTGKNLFNYSSYISANKYTTYEPNTLIINSPTSWQLTEFDLNLKVGQEYIITCVLPNKGELSIKRKSDGTNVIFHDNATTISRTFIGEENLKLRISNRELLNIDVIYNNLMIEEGRTKTSYEPYKSNILTTNEEVELRKVGDVKDELNLLTGELTQRIGEIVFDGSQHWSVASTEYSDGVIFQYDFNLNYGYKLVSKEIICDSFPTLETIWKEGSGEGIVTNGSSTHIQIKSSNCTSSNEFKSWLTTNPIIVQYVLKTPIVKTVGLTTTNQDNTTINKPLSYKDGHIQVSSQEGSLLPSVVDYEIPTLNSVRADKLKPNTTYTFKNNGKDFAPTFNVNGTDHEANNTFTSLEANNGLLMITSQLNDTDRVSLVEGNLVGTEVSYFEGMKSVENPIVRVTGKNLFNLHDEITNADMTTHSITNNALTVTGVWYVIQRLNLKPNTQYTLSYEKADSISGYKFVAVYCDNITKPLQGSTDNKFTFTTPTQFDDVAVLFYAESGNMNNTVTYYNIQLEQGSDATSYEPHKSTTVSSIEDITLRAIGDVKDELDLSTGTLTQRIGEVILDGSSDERWKINNTYDTVVRAYCLRPNTFPNIKNNHCGISDSLPSYLYGNGSVVNGNSDAEGLFHANNETYIRVLKTKLTSLDAKGLCEYLSQNPITVQYELATPIIRKVDLQTLDQDGNEVPTLKLQLPKNIITTSSDCLVPNINIPANINYDTIIKPSTQYTLRFNQDVNTDNPLTVNLGGTEQVVTSNHFTMTTPATLTHNQLQFSGKGNIVSEVQVIEGDVTTVQYPFFEGMNDVNFSDSKFIVRNCPFIFGKGGRI